MQKKNSWLTSKIQNLRWRTKILSLCFIFIVTNLAISGIAIFMIFGQNKNIQGMLQEALFRSNAASQIQIGSAQRSWYQCLLSGSKNEKSMNDAAISMIQSTARLEQYIKRLSSVAENNNAEKRVIELKNILLELRPAQIQILKFLKSHNPSKAEQESQEAMQYAYLMEGLAKDIVENEQKHIRLNLDAVVKTGENNSYVILLITVLVIVMGVGGSLYLADLISAPLKELKAGLTRVAAGDLKVNFEVHATGEIGQLAKTLNETLAALSSAQERLMAQDKMASLGALTAGVAHEIRNPMNFIKNFSETNTEMVKELIKMLGDLISYPQVSKEDLKPILEMLNDMALALEKIQGHTKRIDKIVQGMLQYSGGVTQENPTEVNINSFLDQTITMVANSFKPQDPQHAIKITRTFDTNCPRISVLSSDFSHAITNILNNAFYAVLQKNKNKTMPYIPQVVIKTQLQNDSIQIRIQDNGPGIPADIVKKIFMPFFTTKPTGEGTGLGLSITQDIIINRHHGDIKIHSEPGQYTEVVITLPLSS